MPNQKYSIVVFTPTYTDMTFLSLHFCRHLIVKSQKRVKLPLTQTNITCTSKCEVAFVQHRMHHHSKWCEGGKDGRLSHFDGLEKPPECKSAISNFTLNVFHGRTAAAHTNQHELRHIYDSSQLWCRHASPAFCMVSRKHSAN